MIQDLSKYKLIIITSIQKMTTSAWDRIRKYVENGGIVYHIYDDRTGLNTYFNELFGVEVETPTKNFDYHTLQVKRQWGGFNIGETIKLVGIEMNEYLKVNPKSAEVICEFTDHTPAMLKNKYGKGTAYLVTLPVENGSFDIRYNDFLDNKLYGVYDLLMDEAQVTRKVKCSNSRIEIGNMLNKDSGELLVFAINHDYHDVSAKLYVNSELAKNAKITEVITHKDIEFKEDLKGRYIETTFEPAGVNVYRINR